MRAPLAVFGAILVIAYAIIGLLLMTNWEVAAASGVPIDSTISEMNRAGQPYSPIPGILFAVFGAVLAIVWAWLNIGPMSRFSGWFSLAILGAIIACGTPAYFFASFGNMNSVGDTFADWNEGAAFALVSPLYVASGIAALVAVASLIIGAVQLARTRPTRPGTASTGQLGSAPTGGAPCSSPR